MKAGFAHHPVRQDSRPAPARALALAILCLLWLGASPARAQDAATGIILERDSLRLGINQMVRPGSWTPVRVSFNNTQARPARVRLELLVPDADSDLARYHRSVTLTPQRSGQQVWIHAVAPVQANPKSQWRLQAIDEETGRLLDHQDILLGDRVLEARTTTVGIVGSAMMGLDPYTSDATQNEAVRFFRGLSPDQLPDRWQGLSMMSALVWTSQVDPAGAMVSADLSRAIRQWVRRGGHLVIVLPVIGNNWPSSPLADLLPPARDEVIDDVSPLFLGTSRLPPEQMSNISLRVFEPGPGVTGVLFEKDRPWVVAHQVGLGRVTVIGADLADPRLVQMGLPSSGRWTPWSDIFGWRGPALPDAYIKAEMDAGRMNRPDHRTPVNLGQFIYDQIAMHETAAPRLLLAVSLFVLYWVIAGPTQHVVLKQRRLVHHAWVGFVGVVLVFSMVSWIGAWFLRPAATEIRHVSLLTATRGQEQAHVHSWLLLYVPTHGNEETALGDDDASASAASAFAGGSGNAIWSTGQAGQASESTFSDNRSYAVDVTRTDRVSFAFRSTAKQLELDYLGPPMALPPETGADGSTSSASWQPPTGEISIVDGWPSGALTHQLPGALEHVTVIYNDATRLPNGQLREPWYWLYRDPWPAGRPLPLSGRPANAQPLVAGVAPNWSGRLADLSRRFNNTDAAEQAELLTFFSMLPPPDYLDTSFTANIRVYQRPVGRELDLTPLARLRGIIIIGQLSSAPLPAPLKVDGDIPPSRGETIVRWIIPLPARETSPR